jgi:type IV pilus assembly protein PilY1
MPLNVKNAGLDVDEEERTMKREMERMVGLVLLLVLVWLDQSTPVLAAAVSAPSNGDYTALPPFLPNAVPPNILLLMDSSGSMDNSAYHPSTSTPPSPATQPTGTNVYDPGKPGGYAGYFDQTLCYTYGSNRFTPGIARPSGSDSCGAHSQWDGSFLNYITMTRIEIAKWAMMGGKCAPRVSGNCYPGGKLTLENSSRDAIGVIFSADGVSPLSGTKCFFRNGTNLTILNSSCGGSATSYSLTVDVSGEPTGLIQTLGNKARFGLMEFKSGTLDGGKVLADVGTDTPSMVNAIENTSAGTWTPLAESLYEAMRYFAQVPPAYGGTDYTVNATHDPYYFKSPWASNPGQYVPCCKSFVIIFTDGQPTMDLNIPAALQDIAHTKLPHVTGHDDVCSSYNGGATSDPCVDSGSHYVDDVAYYAHTTDLRPASGSLPLITPAVTPPPITGDDHSTIHNLTVYTFFAFGTGANLLKDTAKAGGFVDANGNNIPDLTQEWDAVNNYTGAKGADGLPDTYFESTNADDLKDKLIAAINSILQRSASGTSASVLASSSTGDGALYQAYFFPSVTEGLNTINWTGYVQALFIDKFGNLREDTVRDQALVYKDDLIVKMVYDTGVVKVQRFRDSDGDGKADLTDTNGDGTPDTAIPISPDINLSSMSTIWEAGKQLAGMGADARNIYTWVDLDNNGFASSTELIQFVDGNASLLKPYLGVTSATLPPFDEHSLIKWVRGKDVTDSSGNLLLRDRNITVDGSKKVWILGDVINSSPTTVGAPKERYDVIYGDASYQAFYQTYRNRRQVIYAGANDGMLHAFNGGSYNPGDGTTNHGYFTKQRSPNPWIKTPDLGNELWAFIPMQLLPHLRWLASDNYSHVYYVDLKPKVTDVRIFCDSGAGSTPPSPCINGQPGVSHPGGWGTILIGGFRMGGSCGAPNCKTASGAVKTMKVTADFSNPPNGNTTDSGDTREFYSAYFVLDITDPESATGPQFLWSFTDADMGFTTSYPSVLRVKPSCSASNCKTDPTGATWYVVFGSGPTNYKVDTIQQGSRLYAYDLTTTPTKKVLPVSVSLNSAYQALMGDVATVDIDLDYRVDVAYVGSLIQDTASSSFPPWKGEMYRLTTPCCTADNWGIAGSAAGTRTPTKMISQFGTTYVGPVTAGVGVTRDDASNIWVFFGTGRFYDSSDKTLSEQQYFFGLKDSVQTGCAQVGATSCLENNLVDVSNANVFTNNTVTGLTGSGASVSTLVGTSTTTSLQGLISTPIIRGWFTKLPNPIVSPPVPPLERVVATPTVAGGIVFFPSFVPQSSMCNSLGIGYLYALFYQTGTAYKDPVLGTDSTATTQSNKSILLGTGQTGQLGIHIGAEGSDNTASATGVDGCQGRVSIIGQSSTGQISKTCVKTLGTWSRYLTWNNQRL